MPDDGKDSKPSGGFSSDFIAKWLPIIILLCSWLITYGGKDNAVQQLAKDIGALTETNKDLSKKIEDLSGRLTAVEVKIELYRRADEQDREYRNRQAK